MFVAGAKITEAAVTKVWKNFLKARVENKIIVTGFI